MSHKGESIGAGWDPGLGGLRERWKPIGKRPGYAAGMLVLSLAVLILPLLYAAMSLQHVHSYRKVMGIEHHSHLDLTAAQFYDVSWDGTPID